MKGIKEGKFDGLATRVRYQARQTGAMRHFDLWLAPNFEVTDQEKLLLNKKRLRSGNNRQRNVEMDGKGE